MSIPGFPVRVAQRSVIRQRAIGPFGILRAEKMGVGAFRRDVEQAFGVAPGQPDVRRQVILDAGARTGRMVEAEAGSVPDDRALRPA